MSNLFQNTQPQQTQNNNNDDGFQSDISFDDLFLDGEEIITRPSVNNDQISLEDNSVTQANNTQTQQPNQYEQQIAGLTNQVQQLTNYILQQQQQSQAQNQNQGQQDPFGGRPMREWINDDDAETKLVSLIVNAVNTVNKPLQPVIQNYQQQYQQQQYVSTLMQRYPDLQQVISTNQDVAREIYQKTGGNVEAVYFALKGGKVSPTRNSQVDQNNLNNLNNQANRFGNQNYNGGVNGNGKGSGNALPKSPKEAALMALKELSGRQ